MSEKPKQTVGLKLRRQKAKHGPRKWVLQYGHIRKDGTVGWAEEDWNFEETSYLPRPFFSVLWSCVLHRVSKIPKQERTFATMEGPIYLALSKVAVKCGCGFEKNRCGGRNFLLKCRRLCAITVVNFENHKDRDRDDHDH